MAHELVHSLGIGRPRPGTSLDSIMENSNAVYDLAQGTRQPGSLLYPIDREALRALYGPLRDSRRPELTWGPGPAPRSTSTWAAAHGAFGVAMRNGYAEPWAHGTAPAGDLAQNRQLSGSVTWAGVLVGFTPVVDGGVAGEAGVTVNLAGMAGSAAFTGLTTVGANNLPVRWGDGDLRYYLIAVSGNVLRETGGDEGRLTGVVRGPRPRGRGRDAGARGPDGGVRGGAGVGGCGADAVCVHRAEAAQPMSHGRRGARLRHAE